MSRMGDLFTEAEEGRKLKEDGMARRELADAAWLAQARDVAAAIAALKGTVTSDDVLEVLPRPDWVHPNTVGCIFAKGEWVGCGFVRTKRKKGHSRMIRQWRMA